MRQLAVLDEADAASDAGPVAPEQQSFVQRTVTTVISNLQVFVETVHVRFEDDVTVPNEPFAVGVTLAGFDAQACDLAGNPTPANVMADIIHKAVRLRHFAVYWNSRQTPLSYNNNMGNRVCFSPFLTHTHSHTHICIHTYINTQLNWQNNCVI